MTKIDWSKWTKERLISSAIVILAGVIHWLVLSILNRYFWQYNLEPDGFIWTVFAIGLMPMLFGRYLFGGIFLLSNVVGFFVDYRISSELLMRGTPNMSGGFAWVFCLCAGFLVGVLAEVVLYLVRRSRRRNRNQPPAF